MGELSTLPNIGEVIEKRLNSIGICTQDLKQFFDNLLRSTG